MRKKGVLKFFANVRENLIFWTVEDQIKATWLKLIQPIADLPEVYQVRLQKLQEIIHSHIPCLHPLTLGSILRVAKSCFFVWRTSFLY